jgi:hypothetical protein
MINEIIRAVAKALDEKFNADGDAYEIYDEEIKQGLKEPAFFVQSLNPSTDLFLGKRYLQHNHILIQYFPKSETGYQAECNAIGEQLVWVMEWITCEGDTRPIRGTNMHHEVVDGVLNFFVDYEFFIRKVETGVPMESLSLKQIEKKGSD